MGFKMNCDKEIISVGEDVLEIETKPITMIFKDPNLTKDIEYANHLKLDLEVCVYHADRTQTYHALTPELLLTVFPGLEETTPDFLRDQGIGVRHAVGRIDMTLKYMDMGVPIAWVHPEDSLHPKAQLAFGDLAIFFANYKK